MISAINTSTAVFKSTGQALQVSFLVMSVEARQDAPMRTALLRMMEAEPRLTRAQADWYDELRGSVSGTINFSGLTSTEIRAQCAMVTAAVETKLSTAEMWAVQARYGQMECAEQDGRKRYAFRADRIIAIQGLSDWIRPAFPSIPSLAMDCVIAKLYANHIKTTISYRDLAASFGASHMLYARTFPKIKDRLRALEKDALDRLTPYFVEYGLIEAELESA